ncbi:integrase [Burkholderia paludis]|uniref:Integrase n=1 Tax=Burkholderia paludis TaxID=1506587 RepID=A0A6J5E7R4_9BURK|nr:hypothetical protein LMG30113_04184 [Burkholderia paludis]VWC02604.1 integrase [Burkholderia paludis]
MPPTDSTAKNAKPADKPYKLTDGGGMYLLMQPDGAKYWRRPANAGTMHGRG